MKNELRTDGSSAGDFHIGQVWSMGDSKLEVGLVGRTLVHYKHYKGLAKRPPTQLSSQRALKQFLQREKAVLVVEAPGLKPAGTGRQSSSKRRASKPAASSKKSELPRSRRQALTGRREP